ncbi:HDOD domain-containing protein [Psychromonas sp. Urea-02u-13]|uniref:HDOD domain-containing protein n=1 Tax=Psychromonas sp. Urea-02u-13 TaxID=2058326 RepID=UPI000C32CF8F|nr:HDOD domain-containing protein [Psychromonas sp. Urea-02u-13]PKG38283.1 histidine kinase [Psychromonas sp. Urea-02u-13]
MNETALISRLNELPRLKQVLQELLEMVNQDDVDFGKLSDKMIQDQILSARLLRMANSAHFGGGKSISSINDAIIRVGSGPVRTLVVASVLSGAFPKLKTLNLKEYWANTFEVATIASKIGAKAGLDPSEVFTTSVLHNIGELMIHSLIPEGALEIENRVEAGENRFDVQQALLTTSSPVLGAKLAKQWKFPDEMVDAILNFNDPSQAHASPKLASTIHLARAIHDVWDDFENEEQKSLFIAQHTSAQALDISGLFFETVDKVRGNGRELAEKLA